MSRDITAIPPIPADGRQRYGDAPSQFFDFWRSNAGRNLGTVVFIHGGFWRAKYDLIHGSHLCAALAQAGLCVASLEYRRVGEPGGGWPGSLDDVLRGAESVRQFFGEDPVVAGHSAGGHLALRMASQTQELSGVVALAPVADLQLAYELNLSNGAVREFLGAHPAEHPELLRAACASRHAASVPRVLVHGTADDVVPIELSRRFVQLRTEDQPGAQLIEVAGANHFDLIDPESSAWPIVRDTVLRIVRSA